MKESVRLSGWGSVTDCGSPDQRMAGPGVDEPEIFTHAGLRHATQAARLCGLAAEQAREGAGYPPETLACVFSSALGELEITDQICSTLAEQPLALSPVLFHNSVHNAASGYWAIAAQSRNPCRAVAAGPFSYAMGLLTALGQVQAEPGTPVLYVYYEMAVPDRFRLVYGSPPARATAFILASAESAGPGSGPGPLLVFEIAPCGTRKPRDPATPGRPDPLPGTGRVEALTFLNGTFPLSEEHDLSLALSPCGSSPA